MHSFSMPDWATRRIVARQGRALAHAEVPASQVALLVVDMQNYFLRPGSQAEVPQAREIVPAINRLAGVLREAAGLVVWIRTIFTPAAADEVSHFHDVLMTPERRAVRSAALADDAADAALWPDLAVHPADVVVTKTRYSAFARGASTLEPLLRSRGIEAVVIAGTMTNVCCDSTARDAMMLNFRSSMVHDANASLTEHEHASALINFALQFGDVVGAEALVDRFGTDRIAAPPPR